MTYVNRCESCSESFEWLAPRFDTPDPACPDCDGPTVRQITAPAVIWSKGISDYGDPSKETYRKDQEAGGHWVYEKNSDQALSEGRPIPRFISSRSDQKDYVRREGLVDPVDVPTNLNVSSDGRSFQTGNLSEV